MEENEEYKVSWSTKILVPTLVLVGVLCYVIYYNTKEIESLQAKVEKLESNEKVMRKTFEVIQDRTEVGDSISDVGQMGNYEIVRISLSKCAGEFREINRSVRSCQRKVQGYYPGTKTKYKTTKWCFKCVNCVDELFN